MLQVYLGGIISGPAPAPRVPGPAAGGQWQERPPEADLPLPCTPLQMQAGEHSAGGLHVLSEPPSQSHVFSAALQLEVRRHRFADSVPAIIFCFRMLVEWSEKVHGGWVWMVCVRCVGGSR